MSVNFPSPDSYGIKSWKPAALTLESRMSRYEEIEGDCAIDYSKSPADWESKSSNANCTWENYARLIRTDTAETKPKAKFAVRATSSFITENTEKLATIVLYTSAKKENGALPVDAIELNLSNATIVSVSARDEKGKPTTAPALALGKIIAKPNTAVEITVRNVSSAAPVIVVASGKKKNKSVPGVHDPVSFIVTTQNGGKGA